MAVEWFYLRAGQIVGPLTAAQLREHALERRVAAADHVRHGGDGDWVPATKVKGLFDAATSARSQSAALPPSPAALPQAAPREMPQPAQQPAPTGRTEPVTAPRRATALQVL